MHIIGGGVIGLCCAWYLHKAGYEVTVVDRTDLQDGCSFGNAGIIVPSHSVPLAAPGMVSQGLRWMFSPKSPFYIRPRMDMDLLRWAWRFYRSCTPEHVERVTPLLKDFHLLSKSLYAELASEVSFEFDYEERGSLMLYRTTHGREEELRSAGMASGLGLRVSHLTAEEIAELHPGMKCDVLGGILYHDDAHLYPGKFVLGLQRALKDAGVRFLLNREVSGFITLGTRVTHLRFGNADPEPIQEVVLACGAWTAHLAGHLGIKLLIQDGKGYSVTFQGLSPRPVLPVILSEARVAVTPMGDDLRIGGTLEVSHFSKKIHHVRVQAILDATALYYPGFPVHLAAKIPVWHGYRPVTADGLPYLGRPKGMDNVMIAAGHAMLGMSLGPGTGWLISEIAQSKSPSLPVHAFDPDRHTH